MYVQFMLWVPFYFCLRLFLCLPLSYLCLVLSVMCQKDMCVVSLVPVFVFCFCVKSTYADLSTVHFLFYFDSFLCSIQLGFSSAFLTRCLHFAPFPLVCLFSLSCSPLYTCCVTLCFNFLGLVKVKLISCPVLCILHFGSKTGLQFRDTWQLAATKRAMFSTVQHVLFF